MPHSSHLVRRSLGLSLAAALASPALIAVASPPSHPLRPHVRVVHTKPVDVRRGSLTISPARAAFLRTSAAAVTSSAVTPRSTWHVAYDAGFDANPPAKAAFQAAVDTWAGIVASPQPIEVSAKFEPKAPGLLGQAGPTGSYAFTGLGDGVSFYPSALADAMTNDDIAQTYYSKPAGYPDISASFSSTESSFYFGTDGLTPPTKLDFESVVLHELGHGLGFVGGMSYSLGVGSDPYPLIYDRFVVSGASTAVTSLLGVTLGSALTGNALSWNGAQGKAANGGVQPKIFAPSPWQPGSSFAHLDETTYTAAANALMTPAINMGEVIHSPGAIVTGIFRDMGWDAVLGTPPGSPTTVAATPLNGGAWVTWAAPSSGSPATSYTVTANPGGATATTADGSAHAIAVNGLSNGTPYTFTVTATNDYGTSPPSSASDPVVPSVIDSVPPTVSITSKPALATKSTSAAFNYTGVDNGRPSAVFTYQCALDTTTLAPCLTPPSYSGLAQGLHTFRVQAFDEALNASPVAEYTWRVDTTAPTVTVTAQPVWTLGSSTVLHYTGVDSGSGIASHKVTYRRAAFNGTFPSTWSTAPLGSSTSSTLTLARGYTYCMVVRFTDKAGNYRDSTPTCTATPVDDGSLARSAGWSYSGGHAGFYVGTYSLAKKSLVSLTRPGLQTRRVSVLALTCASCGALRVYWNGVLIKTVSLYSSTSKHQILFVKDFGSAKTGTLVLRTTSIKPVYVDGLAASRV
ncbi:MAG: large repetitive protein [Frankiales bacterium]|jgi:hypothetical protein|nr:large repetitive protein [Frankiales bacterium]